MEIANMNPMDAMEMLNRQMNESDPRASSLKKPDKKTKIGGVSFSGIITFVAEPTTFEKNGKTATLAKRKFSVCVPTFDQNGIEKFLDETKQNILLPTRWGLSEKNMKPILEKNHELNLVFEDFTPLHIRKGGFHNFQTESPSINHIEIGQVVFITDLHVTLSPKKIQGTIEYEMTDIEANTGMPWKNFECSLVPNPMSKTQLYKEWLKEMLNTFIEPFVLSAPSTSVPIAEKNKKKRQYPEYGQTLLLRTDNILEPSQFLEAGISTHISNTVSATTPTNGDDYLGSSGIDTEIEYYPILDYELVINQTNIKWDNNNPFPLEQTSKKVKVFARATGKVLDYFQFGKDTEAWKAFAPIVMPRCKPILLCRVNKKASAGSEQFNKGKVEGFTTLEVKIVSLYADLQKTYRKIGIPVSIASLRLTNNPKKSEIPLSADIVRLNSDDCPYNAYSLRKDYAALGVQFVLLVNLKEATLARCEEIFAQMDPATGDEIAKILEAWPELVNDYLDRSFVAKSEAERIVKSFAENIDPENLKLAYFALFPKTENGNADDARMVVSSKNHSQLQLQAQAQTQMQLQLPPPIVVEEIGEATTFPKRQKLETEDNEKSFEATQRPDSD